MAYELQEKELAMIEDTQKHSLIYRQFVDKVKDCIDNDVELNFADLKRFAKQFGVPDDNYSIIINLAELAIVEYCSLKNVREWPNKSDREAFEELKHIYQIQPKITTKDGQAKLLQQYSTPCPIAWLMGKYVYNGNSNKTTLEPSAGNGMLTIALWHLKCWVNDLDEIRFNNLELQDYPIKYMEVTNLNARELPYPDKSFDCVVTNPPFQKIERNFMSRKGKKGDHTITYDFKKLDHELAILALDKMKDSGRCAIIVGGNIDYETHEKNVYWDKDGRFKNGAFKTFVSYLHRQYNIEDIIYINGDMYKKQGTNFPIILLLINGRKEWDSAPTTRWHDYDESLDKQINTFDALFERVYKHIGGKAEASTNKAVSDIPKEYYDEAKRLLTRFKGEKVIEYVFKSYEKDYDSNPLANKAHKDTSKYIYDYIRNNPNKSVFYTYIKTGNKMIAVIEPFNGEFMIHKGAISETSVFPAPKYKFGTRKEALDYAIWWFTNPQPIMFHKEYDKDKIKVSEDYGCILDITESDIDGIIKQLWNGGKAEGLGAMDNQIKYDFNNDLRKFFANALNSFLIGVTAPKNNLLSCGIPNTPIVVKPSTINEKIEKHGLTHEMLKNLNTGINYPLFVFRSETHNSDFLIVTDKHNDEGLLSVALSPNKKINKTIVSEIKSIGGRNVNQIGKYITNGSMLYCNREKIEKVLSDSWFDSSKCEYLLSLLDDAKLAKENENTKKNTENLKGMGLGAVNVGLKKYQQRYTTENIPDSAINEIVEMAYYDYGIARKYSITQLYGFIEGFKKFFDRFYKKQDVQCYYELGHTLNIVDYITENVEIRDVMPEQQQNIGNFVSFASQYISCNRHFKETQEYVNTKYRRSSMLMLTELNLLNKEAGLAGLGRYTTPLFKAGDIVRRIANDEQLIILSVHLQPESEKLIYKWVHLADKGVLKDVFVDLCEGIDNTCYKVGHNINFQYTELGIVHIKTK